MSKRSDLNKSKSIGSNFIINSNFVAHNKIVPDYYPFNICKYVLYLHFKNLVKLELPYRLECFKITNSNKDISNIRDLVLYNHINRFIGIANSIKKLELTISNEIPKPISINDKIESLDDLINIAKKYKDDSRNFTIDVKILARLIEPLELLNETIGMELVKEQILDQILSSLQNLYDEDQRFHTVIQGPPGVGKTMLAKILGDIYSKMGILKNNSDGFKFTIARRSDLVGKFLGHTAKQTQEFIDKCDGGVLFIDEVYSLGNVEKRDSYSKECIDTLNLNLTEKTNFICIIAGYPKEIEECFFAYNSGLKRRFPFVYEVNDYTVSQLAKIMMLKIEKCKWKLHPDVTYYWLEHFFSKNSKDFPHFGGDIDTLILNIKTVHGKRIFGKDIEYRKIITIDDIEKGFIKFKESKKKTIDNDPPYGMYT